jgi:hypothetical protein
VCSSDIIGRSVINYDDLNMRIVLGGDALEAKPDILLVIEARDPDDDLLHGEGASFSFVMI